MREPIHPRLEFYWGPALWGAGTLIVLTTISIFLLQRPGWMVLSAIVAGMVTAAKSGFYGPSGNNAFVGVFIGMAGLFPVFLLRRFLAYDLMMETAGDVLFMVLAHIMADYFVAVLVLPLFGYIGASLFDLGRGHLPVDRFRLPERRG